MKNALFIATSLWLAALFPLASHASAAQVCGDGIVQAPEACDDGNTVGGDSCPADCGAPAPTLSVADVSAAEGPNVPAQADFTISRAGSTSYPLNVGVYTSAGTTNPAGSGDYTAILDGTRLVIPAGATSVTYSVRITADTLAELDETFKLNLEYAYRAGAISMTVGSGSYAVGSGPQGLVAADFDGDGYLDLFSVNQAAGTFSALRNTGTPGSVSFASAVTVTGSADGLAAATGDLDGDGKTDVVVTHLSTTNKLTFARNTSTTGALSFATSTVTITNPLGVSVGDLDGDGKPEVIVAGGGSSVTVLRNTSTGAGVVSFDGGTSFNVQSGARAIGLGDFNADGKLDLAVSNYDSNTVSVLRNTSTGSGNIGFAAAQNFATGTGPWGVIAADLDNDLHPEIVTVNQAAGTLSVLANATVSTSSVNFAAKQDFATGNSPYFGVARDMDGDGQLDLVTANTDSGSVTVLRSTLVETGNASYSAQSYTVNSRPIQVAAADFDGDGQVDIATTRLDAADVKVVRNNRPSVSITDAEAVATITDDDEPTVQFSAATSTANESDGSKTVTVTMTGTKAASITVNYSVGGTATQGTDYTISPSSLTFASGETSKTLTISGLADSADDASATETIVLTLQDPASAALGTNTTHTLTLTNDSNTPAPVIAFSATTSSVNESAGTATITVTKTGTTSQTVNVTYTVGGTATQGTDYTLSPATLTFAPADTSKTITVSGLTDAFTDAASTETIVLTLDTPSNATLGTNTGHTLTITNDSNTPPPVLTMQSASSSVAESAASKTVTVLLSRASTDTVTVGYTLGGTAGEGSDYSISPSTISFAPGETSKAITLFGFTDSVVEPDETAVITLDSPTNAVLGSAIVHTLTITNTTPAPPTPTPTPTPSGGGGGGSLPGGTLLVLLAARALRRR